MKRSCWLLFALLACLPTSARAQRRDSTAFRPHVNGFVEALGAGGWYSVNGELQFDEHIVIRAGASYEDFFFNRYRLVLPLGASLLIGPSKVNLEVGFGGVVVFGGSNRISGHAGLRRYTRSGIMVRLGLGFFGLGGPDGDFPFPTPYLSVGRAF